MPLGWLRPERQFDRMRVPYGVSHDSAAALVVGGRVVAAIEEERLSRVKHTSRFPVLAIRACLDLGGLKPESIDRFAYYSREGYLDQRVRVHTLSYATQRAPWSAREYLVEVLSEALGTAVRPDRLAFVSHHESHAMSAYGAGPYPEALVVTIDAAGDGSAGSVWIGRGGRLSKLLDIPMRNSLGFLYQHVIKFIGYGPFDEYKVMGLAPFGDPTRFHSVFESMCQLLPDGGFEVDPDLLLRLNTILPFPRRAGEAIQTVHKDIAAALQRRVETTVLHLLTHYQRQTGLRNLCMAGGVALNSTMNGVIARSGLFDGVFIQPAAYDAGCALGAAISVHNALATEPGCEPITHVFLGKCIGDSVSVGRRLEQWGSLIRVSRTARLAEEVAQLLLEGQAVGWVQGRSEFGPRALGNRSILADPRPERSRCLINDLIKERESFRPFAPVIAAEDAADWFELSTAADYAFMSFTAHVRADTAIALAATTHIDGSARVQTVSRAVNPRLWELLMAFRALTGVAALLNTSFNHSVEPIVDSIDDAVTCLLTSKLNYLAIDEYVVSKSAYSPAGVASLVPHLPPHVRLAHSRCVGADGAVADHYECASHSDPHSRCVISQQLYELLAESDGTRTLGELAGNRSSSDDVILECEGLWRRRLLRCLPAEHDASAE
jgi:carbamoyltransferase